MSSKNSKTQITCFRLTHERVAQLEALMTSEGIDKTAAVNMLLSAGLKAIRKKRKKELTA